MIFARQNRTREKRTRASTFYEKRVRTLILPIPSAHSPSLTGTSPLAEGVPSPVDSDGHTFPPDASRGELRVHLRVLYFHARLVHVGVVHVPKHVHQQNGRAGDTVSRREIGPRRHAGKAIAG